MSVRYRKWLLGLAVTALVVLLALPFMFMFNKLPASPRLPSPNGYDDFLKAASLVTGNPGSAATLDHDGLRALLSNNAEPLALLRLGLSRQCTLPEEAAMANVPGMLSDLANLKRLAQLLAAEGRQREEDKQALAAAQSYVEAIRFGNEMSRGGFVINRLVGIACEAIGNAPLSKLVPKLSPKDARLVLIELEKIEDARIHWDEITRNENRFSYYRMRQGFNPILWVASRWQVWQSRKRAEVRNNRVEAHLRLIITELALRCFVAQQGHSPHNLKQLAPGFLPTVPMDPFSGRPLLYRTQQNGWLLYSVGEDGVDDGGKPVGRGFGLKGDIFYDSPY